MKCLPFKSKAQEPEGKKKVEGTMKAIQAQEGTRDSTSSRKRA
jgi:hypothetical protein